MKCATEMQNLRAAFTMTRGHVLAHLPIHGGLQTIFDCERTALDKEIAFQRRQSDHALKRLDKFRVAFRVNIGVRDFHLGRPQKIVLHIGIIEVRMIKPNRHRAEKSVKIDQPAITGRIVQIGTVALLEIDYDLEAVEQHMLLDYFENIRWRYSFLFFALFG